MSRGIKSGAAPMSLAVLAALMCFAPRASYADGAAAFDLSGPRVEMKVMRAGKTLPIANVPNLQTGDRLWIHPDFPDSQSVHFLVVVAFLRGATNPPPENWFTRAEAWNKGVREEGFFVTVPQGAQQALLFLAPETGGDYGSLRASVRGKPGVFVRASQDLNQASLDRSRLDQYMQEVRESAGMDAKQLHDRSVLLARTLNIRLEMQCFDKPLEQQPSCLMQNSDQKVLDDGHSQSMVAALTSGPSTDLIGVASTTSLAGGGSYSPYVGVVVDLAKIMESFRSPEYQYIPALALPKQEELNLRLNNPPSFRKPKSVIVVGLPAVEAAQLPPLRPVHPGDIFCLDKPGLVLPVEGAPLVFSTDIGHHFTLEFKDKAGAEVNLPAKADAVHGGFVIDTKELKGRETEADFTATLRGSWGFEIYEGPRFDLKSSRLSKWNVTPAEQSALVVGRDDTLHVQSACATCVEKVSFKNEKGAELKTTWKIVKPDTLEVQVALKDEKPGTVTMAVEQFGMAKGEEVPLHTYSEAAHLEHFTINSGDHQGILRGTRLDEVDSVELKGVKFSPAKLSRANEKDELRVAAPGGPQVNTWLPDEKLVAHVALKDARVLDLQTTVEAPRPKVTLMSKNVQPGPTPTSLRFGNQDELPQDARLSFFLKSVIPEKFAHSEKIEVATMDEAFHAMLSVADGNLVLQDAENVLATLDPLKSFGASAFGPLQFRPLDADGTKGDWQPLVSLVRLPTLKEIRCPDSPDKQCRLSGTNLFLIDSVASDPQFKVTTPVPAGFMESSMSVPRPNGTLLYIKLRDDPATVNMLVLPVLPEER
ncbi:MAG TPA: hypothetical protein VGH83_02890 [Candidatus Acidoferrum sp.]